MKPPPFEYHAPRTLADAVRLRAELGPDASLLAGGQSLVPVLNMRLARPSALIDLNRVGELDFVRHENGALAVGAMTRHRQLERSEKAARACPILREALGLVAHAIVRNRGTVGGSIAHADPAAELPAVLVALGGHATVRSVRGERTIPAEALFRFHFTTSLDPDEILTGMSFPALAPGDGHAVVELSRRHGDYALAGVACVIRSDGVRLGLFGVGPTPILVESDDPDRAADAAQPTGDIHATAEYRRLLVRELAARAVAAARGRMRRRAG